MYIQHARATWTFDRSDAFESEVIIMSNITQTTRLSFFHSIISKKWWISNDNSSYTPTLCYVAAADLGILSSVPLVLDWASPEQHHCYWPRVSPSHLPRLLLAEAALFHTSSRLLIGGEVSTFTPRTWPPLATGHHPTLAHCTSSPQPAGKGIKLLTMIILRCMENGESKWVECVSSYYEQ